MCCAGPNGCLKLCSGRFLFSLAQTLEVTTVTTDLKTASSGTFEKPDNRNLLASIVESSDDAITSMTPEGIITSWNRGAERMFGYPAGEIVGRSSSVLTP